MKILHHSCHQAIKLNNAAIASVSTGHIINLVSVDSQKFDFVSLQMVNIFIKYIYFIDRCPEGLGFPKGVYQSWTKLPHFLIRAFDFKIS